MITNVQEYNDACRAAAKKFAILVKSGIEDEYFARVICEWAADIEDYARADEKDRIFDKLKSLV